MKSAVELYKVILVLSLTLSLPACNSDKVEKIDFYDRKNSLLKTLTYTGYKKYLDKFWRADVMHMVNHQTGKSTTLSWSNYKFKTGLTEKDFNRNSLKRAK